MSNYYYFMSSLPCLTLNLSDLPSLETFWASSEGVLKGEDRKVLQAVLKEEKLLQAPEIVKRWISFQEELRQALARHRAQELGRGTREVYASGSHAQVWHIIQGVWSRLNPLERELYLIEQVFLTLEQWASALYPFSFQALVVYLLQLKLLLRRCKFQQKQGLLNFECIYSQVKDKILSKDGGSL